MVTPVDILRRAGAEVVVAALNGKVAAGRCGIRIEADVMLEDIAAESFDLLLIPGGPGVWGMREDGRAAVLARLGPQAATSAADTPYTPRGALPLPQSLRTVAQGQRADGSAVTAQAVWFARAAGPEVRLFHAVVYSQKPRPEVADQFFAGLALP